MELTALSFSSRFLDDPARDMRDTPRSSLSTNLPTPPYGRLASITSRRATPRAPLDARSCAARAPAVLQRVPECQYTEQRRTSVR
jgi:hypothetical protein